MTTTRDEFEARGQRSKRLLWKRGGSVFAEDVPEGDYVDAGVQHDWLMWQEAWQASRLAALEEAAEACEGIDPVVYRHGGDLHDDAGATRRQCIEAIRSLAKEG